MSPSNSNAAAADAVVSDVRQWIVDEGEVEHRVSLQADASREKLFVRVDGKLAGRPISAHESERVIRVGSFDYKIRRLADGAFELEPLTATIPPPGPAMEAAPPKPKRNSSQSEKLLLGVAAVFALFLMIVWGIRELEYRRIPWQRWSTPDNTASIDFPQTPREVKEIDGEAVEYPLYEASYKKHDYGFAYFEIEEPVREDEAYSFLGAITDEMFEEGSTIKERKEIRIGEHRAIEFLVSTPAAKGEPATESRGYVTVHKKRVFLAAVDVPPGHIDRPDVSRFLESIKLPDGAPYAYASAQPSSQSARRSRSNPWPARMLGRFLAALVVFVLTLLRMRALVRS